MRIAGSEPCGLLAGVGHFLHTTGYGEGTCHPAHWRGISLPECPVRGIFFALHNNWYALAPRAEIHRYIEDLGLWGINTICFHFPQYEDPTTPEARAALAEFRELLRVVKRLGMKVALLKEPNIGFVNPPAAIRAAIFPDTIPPRRGTGGPRVCPSRPAGFAYLSHMLATCLDGFTDIGVDYIVTFPYDAGGCGCADCWPWGARGYLTIAQEFFRLARERYPECKRVLGTWCFDVREESDGEYPGLAQRLAQDDGWVDYLMADSHEDFPRFLLEHGVPGNLPVLNFAEISMWGRFPWGGSGANPLPARFQRLWDQAQHLLAGGFPYSEGNFEDINKIICSRFYWKKDTPATDAVRAYIAYEFSPVVVELVAEAITLLERTYPHTDRQSVEVERAYALIQQADTVLPPRARASWRWRILYLRAVIDHELINHDNEPTDRCDAAYEELIRLYHVENGWFCIAPPSRAYLARQAMARRQHEETAPLPPGAEEGMVKNESRRVLA